jgi:signal transduction histidine kinase
MVLVDLLGSAGMIVLSLLCLKHVRALRRRNPDNLIWAFLLWVCLALATFAVSRSAGHILKQALLVTGHATLWGRIAAVSGTINTFTLIIVASITLFFQQVWTIHQKIIADQAALRETHEKLLYLNQNLERIVADRTADLARSEKQMAQADKLASIGQLSSGVAHEINNPLGIILGYTQLLLRGETPETQRYEDLKTIEKHVRNCKTIVEDLLNFARSSPTQKERVDVHETVDEILGFIQHHSKLDGIRIEREYDDAVPPLLLDEKKMKQVLINLVMNAKHAVGREGTIRIATRMDAAAGQVRLAVRDDGYGIEEKDLGRIFDPFFTTKPTGEGTGLGLAVSYGIVKHHGGDILVDSRPGAGSEFTVTLPMETREVDGRSADHSGC